MHIRDTSDPQNWIEYLFILARMEAHGAQPELKGGWYGLYNNVNQLTAHRQGRVGAGVGSVGTYPLHC